MKIKSIKLKNFRGVGKEVELKANSTESILLYGDNGTGKSSFLDAIEWFIKNKVSHLTGEEIETHGGLRHQLSNQDEESFVELKFSSNLENRKTLEIIKNEKLKSSFANKNEDFNSMIDTISNEHLWIRNRELVDFIIKSKTQRLADISNIIGYNEVSKIKSILKASVNDIKSVIRNKNFQSGIAQKKQRIAEKTGSVIHDSDQFYPVVNKLLKEHDTKTEVVDKKTLKNAIGELISATDEKGLQLRKNLERIKDSIENIQSKIELNIKTIDDYIKKVQDVQSDAKNIKNNSLAKLYKEAEKILKNHHDEDNCPLCLSEIKKEDLLEIISIKLDVLRSFDEKTSEIEIAKAGVIEIIQKLLRDIEGVKDSLNEIKNHFKTESELLKGMLNSETILKRSEREIKKNIFEIDLNKLQLNKEIFIAPFISIYPEIKSSINKQRDTGGSEKINLISNIKTAEESFDDLLNLKNEESVINYQLRTLEKIASKFSFKEKEEMTNFLKIISEDLNKFFLFMNHKDKVDNVEITTIDNKNGDFSGIALKFKFHGKEEMSPRKFLSESYVNCLGLSLFLSSVKIFNKKAKFIILDDVISSFDESHRYRFGRLLLEEFSQYQLIILTHERNWFDFMAYRVKGRGWHINETFWSESDGTQIKIPLITYREKIDNKIGKSDKDGLGNLIRQYAENILKELSILFEVEFAFKRNEQNEKRTLNELYCGFMKRIKNKSPGLTNIVKTLESAFFFENASSHDGKYRESLSDLKAIYSDLKAFEDAFKCTEGDCKKFVSLDFLNPTENYIACKCGNKKIHWQSN